MRGLPPVPAGCTLLGLACLLFSGCTDSRPPKPRWHSDTTRCEWQWREGGDIGLWVERCRLSTGQWQVAWDDGRRAFIQQHEGRVVGIVVQSWVVPVAEGIKAMTAHLTRAGQLPAEAPCEWKPFERSAAPVTRAYFVFSPSATGALGPTTTGEIPEPLCGPYGASAHGVRYFFIDTRWPDRVVFVEEGQERPMFDPSSITVLR